MASNTREMRSRIRSVKNTAQLTKAMKMVAAAKLRRTQEAMLAARPYSALLKQVLADVARRTDPKANPLLAIREPKRIELFVLTGDKGLCGAFNTNIIRAADNFRAAQLKAGREVRLTLLGRKGSDYYRRRPQVDVRERHTDVFKSIDFAFPLGLAAEIEQRFLSGETDAVFVAYNAFRSVIAQKVTVEPLLPLVDVLGVDEDESPAIAREGIDFIYEPDPASLLSGLLSRYLAFELYHAMLESSAAENGARMAAMDNATRNANEMISKLTLTMNQIRQAAITKEIIEVVSGAESLG